MAEHEPSELISTNGINNFTNHAKPIVISSEDEHYAYQKYISIKKEWPGYKPSKSQGSLTAYLIGEIYRFVPSIQGKYFEFHPFNMPEVTIGKVEFVGIITKLNIGKKYIGMTVDDGTGAIFILHNRDYYKKSISVRKQIDRKHERRAKLARENKSWLDAGTSNSSQLTFHKERPSFAYSPEIPILYRANLEHQWWLETKYGLLGKELKCFDFVHVEGHCSLDFECRPKPREKITYEDLSLAKLIFFASKVECICERDYNKMLQLLINTKVKGRYQEPKQ